MKNFKYFIEFILVKFWIWLIRLMPLSCATKFSAKFFVLIGSYLKANKVAARNLKRIFPEYDDKKIADLVKESWENLGKIAAEIPIMAEYDKNKFQKFVTLEGLENLLAEKNQPALFFAAHLANWEILGRAINYPGCKFNVVYRPANNKLVDKLINDFRIDDNVNMIPKSSNGAKAIIKALKNNQHVVMLMDQKKNDGIKVPFLGFDAMTADAIAKLSLKFNCPIVPVQVIREKDSHFRIIIHPKLGFKDTEERNIYNIINKINDIIGQWVLKNPGQWFWFHQRWIK